ncbi:uncharacterized protein [Malus domestica]|uniref:uncharacterized protein isoform X2 n=1 Tax=Malus domestica TaxID=3750 RepID=UPI003975F12B
MVPSVRLLLDFASHLLGILEPRFFSLPHRPFYLLFSVAIFLQIGRPIESGEVSMYVYRITACNLSHLSHTRVTVNFVVLFRKHWCSNFGVLLKKYGGSTAHNSKQLIELDAILLKLKIFG